MGGGGDRPNLMLAQVQVFCPGPGPGPGPDWDLTWTGPGPTLGPGLGPGPELDNIPDRDFFARSDLYRVSMQDVRI